MIWSATSVASTVGREYFPHDVDVEVRAFGAIAAKACEQAAHLLTGVEP